MRFPTADTSKLHDVARDIATVSDWQTPDMGDALREPTRSATPIVFVHGDLDTSTPIDNILGLLPWFANGHAILVHRAGHDGTFYQLRDDAVAKQAIYDFLRTGDASGLPVAVALPAPRFEVPGFAPPHAHAGTTQSPAR